MHFSRMPGGENESKVSLKTSRWEPRGSQSRCWEPVPHLHRRRRSAPLENKIYFPNASSEQLIHFNSVTGCVDTQRIKLLSFPANSKPFVLPAFRGTLLLEAGVLLRGHGGGGALGFGLLVVPVSLCCGIVLTAGHHQGLAAGSCSPAGGCCWPGHRAFAGLTATLRGGAQMATTAPDPQGQFRAGLRAAAAPPCNFGRLCVPSRNPITLYPLYIHLYIHTYTYMCIYKIYTLVCWARWKDLVLAEQAAGEIW